MRGKRDSPKRPTGLCKRDIKISLQIASTTFPFRSRSTYRIETRERLTALVPSRFYMRFAVVSLSRAYLDSIVERREIFLQSLRFYDYGSIRLSRTLSLPLL